MYQRVFALKKNIDIENNYIKKIIIVGGCPGNLLGISKLIENRNKEIDVVLSLHLAQTN